MIDVDEFQELKSTVDRMQKESDKAEGALQQLKKQMKDEFDCPTIKDAKQLVSELDQQEKQTTKQYQSELVKFKESIKQHIQVNDD